MKSRSDWLALVLKIIGSLVLLITGIIWLITLVASTSEGEGNIRQIKDVGIWQSDYTLTNHVKLYYSLPQYKILFE